MIYFFGEMDIPIMGEDKDSVMPGSKYWNFLTGPRTRIQFCSVSEDCCI